MKKFLAVFRCAENSSNHQRWKALSSDRQNELLQKGAQEKNNWEQKYKNQIEYSGYKLSDSSKRIDQNGILDFPSIMGAFCIVRAENHDEAAKVFISHPHFAIFPGDSIEVMECQE